MTYKISQNIHLKCELTFGTTAKFVTRLYHSGFRSNEYGVMVLDPRRDDVRGKVTDQVFTAHLISTGTFLTFRVFISSFVVYLQYSLQRSPIILDELNPALSCFRLLIVQSSVFHLLSILERTGIFALPRSFWLLVWVHVRAPRKDEQRTNGKPRKYLLIGQQQTERAHIRKSTVSSPGFEFPRQKLAFLANNSK